MIIDTVNIARQPNKISPSYKLLVAFLSMVVITIAVNTIKQMVMIDVTKEYFASL